MTKNPRNLLSLGAVGVGAAALGMVLAGGLGVTPAGNAREAADTPARKAATPVAVPSVMGGYPDFATLAERVNAVGHLGLHHRRGRRPRRCAASTATSTRSSSSSARRKGPQGRPNQPPTRQGAGSGFFISEDGLAVTNNHVVEGADKIQVLLADDASRLDAKVVGRDPATDIALIKVEGKGPFVPLALGDSERLRVGEWVMAVGNPLNMDAHRHRRRRLGQGPPARPVRQTQLLRELHPDRRCHQPRQLGRTARQPARRGGRASTPRSTRPGRTSASRSRSTPLKMRAAAAQGEGQGRPRLSRRATSRTSPTRPGGVQPGLDATARSSRSVVKGGPADKAGLEKGDTIVAVNGVAVKETRQLIDDVVGLPPDSKVEIDVVRDGKRKAFTVTLGERPGHRGDGRGRDGRARRTRRPSSASRCEDLSARSRRSFEIPRTSRASWSPTSRAGSVAEEAGLRRGRRHHRDQRQGDRLGRRAEFNHG